MSTKIFISYRRDDSAFAARGVHDRLEREFGRDSVFMDVDSIALGVDFVDVLGAAVAKCDALLAIIGPDWLDTRDETGRRRLDNDHDFVRVEIAAALKRDIPVIPILLEGTYVPKPEHLPDDLDGLARRNGLDVRHASFHEDLDRLVRALRGTVPATGAPAPDRAVRSSKAENDSGVLAPPAFVADGRSAEVPLAAGGSEPVVAKDRSPKVARLLGPRLLIGAALLSATVPVGLLFYLGRAPELRDCANVCPAMIEIPAGTFIMGSPTDEPRRYSFEGPQHEVTIAVPFAVSKYEVTFDEWDACVAANACPHVEDRGGRGRKPVINVSWDAAKQYVRWLSKVTGKAYRLLTESEWEYAARAGSKTSYSWGNAPGTGNANCANCGSRWDGRGTAPVGSFRPNAFGLHDMHGNAGEWVEDVFHDRYDGAPADGSAWLRGGDPSNRTHRDGSWLETANFLRSASRGMAGADERRDTLGFRVARALTP